jgi:hypothetical protein
MILTLMVRSRVSNHEARAVASSFETRHRRAKHAVLRTAMALLRMRV